MGDAVTAAAEVDARHLIWRGEPQPRPTQWICSGCGHVAHSPEGRAAHRLTTVLAAATPHIREQVAREIRNECYAERHSLSANRLCRICDHIAARITREGTTP